MNIREFLEDPDKYELSIEMKPIGEYQDFFEELGFELEDLTGENTNGWQIDFWYYFTHKDKKRLKLSGCLWYGDFKLNKIT